MYIMLSEAISMTHLRNLCHEYTRINITAPQIVDVNTLNITPVFETIVVRLGMYPSHHLRPS
jgi:hypothetical protein